MAEQTVTIHIQLLNEPFWRPTQGVPLGDGAYEVLATPGYESSEEMWEFLPGSVVWCFAGSHDGEPVLFARELIRPKR